MSRKYSYNNVKAKSYDRIYVWLYDTLFLDRILGVWYHKKQRKRKI